MRAYVRQSVTKPLYILDYIIRLLVACQGSASNLGSIFPLQSTCLLTHNNRHAVYPLAKRVPGYGFYALLP